MYREIIYIKQINLIMQGESLAIIIWNSFYFIFKYIIEQCYLLLLYLLIKEHAYLSYAWKRFEEILYAVIKIKFNIIFIFVLLLLLLYFYDY